LDAIITDENIKKYLELEYNKIHKKKLSEFYCSK